MFNETFTQLLKLITEADAKKRIRFLIQRFPDLSPKLIIFIVKSVDPKQGNYSEWIVRNYQKLNSAYKSRFKEDAYKIREALQIFDKYKGKIEIPKESGMEKLSDINKLKSFNELYDVIDEHAKPLIRKAQKTQEEDVKSKDVKKLRDDDKWLVLIPNPMEASCKYGSETRWCTAATGSDNYFDRYNRQGPLYIFIRKEDQEKWQFHFQSDSYMNSDDEGISIKEFAKEYPELKDLLIRLAKENENSYAFMQLDMDGYIEKTYGGDTLPEKLHWEPFEAFLKAGMKYPDKLNAAQNMVHFNQGSFQLQTKLMSDLKDFIGGRNRKNVVEIIENDESGNMNYNHWEGGEYESDMWDLMNGNADTLNEIAKKAMEFGFDPEQHDLQEFVDDEENDTQEIKDAIRFAYYDALESKISSKLYTAAIEPITDMFGETTWVKDRWRFSKKFGTAFVDELSKLEAEYLEDLETWSATDWTDKYASALDKSDELLGVDLDRVYNSVYLDRSDSDYFNECVRNHLNQ